MPAKQSAHSAGAGLPANTSGAHPFARKAGSYKRGWLLLLLLVLGSTAQAADRIISLGGDVTEIVYALGAGKQLVARDLTSTWPQQVQRLPSVGYLRTLGTEGVLSLQPDLILAAADAGPPSVLSQLKASGVNIVSIPQARDLAEVQQKIRVIAQALQRDPTPVLQQLNEDAQRLTSARNKTDVPVLFLLTHAGTPQVAGRDTSAAAMIQLAGAHNAVEQFEGYRPLTPEALAVQAPEVVLITREGLEQLGGAAALWRLPGLSATPAGRHHRLIAIDALPLLGFGPRTAATAVELAQALQASLKP